MIVSYIAPDAATARHIHGPGDLYALKAGVVVVEGAPAERDAAHWSAALGLAAMRGLTVQGSAS